VANGDAAAAAGMDVVASSADARLAYDEINKTRDYEAAHRTSGTHTAAQIVSGELPVVRGGTGSATAAGARLNLGFATGISTTSTNTAVTINHGMGAGAFAVQLTMATAAYSGWTPVPRISAQNTTTGTFQFVVAMIDGTSGILDFPVTVHWLAVKI
jgi:hypothetical protein